MLSVVIPPLFWCPSHPDRWLGHPAPLVVGWDFCWVLGVSGSHPRSSRVLSPAGSYLQTIIGLAEFGLLLNIFLHYGSMLPFPPIRRSGSTFSFALCRFLGSPWKGFEFVGLTAAMCKYLILHRRRWPSGLIGHTKDLSERASSGLNNA